MNDSRPVGGLLLRLLVDQLPAGSHLDDEVATLLFVESVADVLHQRTVGGLQLVVGIHLTDSAQLQ